MNEDTHPAFLRRLEASNYPVWLTQRWLRSMQYGVEMHVTKPTPTHAEWAGYSDDGDLYVNGRRVEVKWRDQDFTCAEDWPFRHGPINEQFFVCNKPSFDRSVPRPVKFVYWNKRFTHVAVVLANTSPHWVVKKVTDRGYGSTPVTQDTYCCPLSCVDFRQIPPAYQGRVGAV